MEPSQALSGITLRHNAKRLCRGESPSDNRLWLSGAGIFSAAPHAVGSRRFRTPKLSGASTAASDVLCQEGVLAELDITAGPGRRLLTSNETRKRIRPSLGPYPGDILVSILNG